MGMVTVKYIGPMKQAQAWFDGRETTVVHGENYRCTTQQAERLDTENFKVVYRPKKSKGETSYDEPAAAPKQKEGEG